MKSLPDSLWARAKAITKLSGYSDVIITPEGYGTLLKREGASDCCIAVAESLRRSAEALRSPEAVRIYMEALYFYLRAQALSADNVAEYALRQRRLCKFVDDILAHTRMHNMASVKNILKWALFNLKMQCLLREHACLAANMDMKGYKYVLNELNSLSLLYASSPVGTFNLVKIEDLEAAIRQKLQESENRPR